MNQAIVTLYEANNQRAFEAQCNSLVAKGYVLVSASCPTIGDNDGRADTYWTAIFALPQVTLIEAETGKSRR